VRASRITYVGELGWELYVPTEFMLGVYDELAAAGAGHGLVHAGYHALNSLRIEKAYRHWGHDITDEDTPLEAGLAFAVKFDKAGGFIGRDALLRQKQSALRKRLVQFKLKSPEPLLYHNEPIWKGGSIVGFIRSGMYGHTLGAAVGLGYVTSAPDTAPGLRPQPSAATITTSRWPGPGMPPPPLYSPCTTLEMSESNVEHNDLKSIGDRENEHCERHRAIGREGRARL
jgi:glycine cleavage system aminomethyltransferase T